MALDLQIGQGPSLQLEQRQVMTQRQIQSMKLLQYSALELQQHVAQIEAQNPAIEVVNNMEELSGDIFEDSFTSHDSEDSNGISEELHQYRLDSATGSKSLYDTLLNQLGELIDRDEDSPLFRGCRQVLGNLNDNGYLEASDAEIAKGADITEEEAREAVEFIQKNIEPAGIGGHDMREALILQLERKGEGDSLACTILRDFWKAFQKQQAETIAEGADVEIEDVEDAFGEIEELNPRPGNSIDTTPTTFICPEVSVARRQGRWEINVIDSSIPTVSIVPDYEEMLQKKDLDKETRQTIQKYIEEGKQLINDIEFRKSTLMRVTEVIVKKQAAFLAHGVSELKPLGLEEIARQLKLHVSTISRAVANKYMQLPGHVVSYKTFFQQKVGGDLTHIAVKQKLKELIDGENKFHPYSDQQLTDLLLKQGVKVSRRVVNKYREAMQIPAAAGRRQRS